MFITGATVANPYLAIIQIAGAAAFANFLLGAAWGACVDKSGNQAGVVSAYMNTAGQIGYTASDAAEEHGIKLEVVKLPTEKRICPLATSLGRRAKFHLDVSVSPFS